MIESFWCRISFAWSFQKKNIRSFDISAKEFVFNEYCRIIGWWLCLVKCFTRKFVFKAIDHYYQSIDKQELNSLIKVRWSRYSSYLTYWCTGYLDAIKSSLFIELLLCKTVHAYRLEFLGCRHLRTNCCPLTYRLNPRSKPKVHFVLSTKQWLNRRIIFKISLET